MSEETVEVQLRWKANYKVTDEELTAITNACQHMFDNCQATQYGMWCWAFGEVEFTFWKDYFAEVQEPDQMVKVVHKSV